MNHIGFQCNYTTKTNLLQRLSPSLLNRIALIEAHLRPAGWRLFVYTPRQVRAGQQTVPGFVFDGSEFVAVETSVPNVNGNWTHRTRRLLEQGMGYDAFGHWANANLIGIYVPYAFSELIGNKLETYKIVRGFDDALHPYCEPYRHSRAQLEHFLDIGRLAFLKPTTGSKGNRIVTLRRDADGLIVTHYENGKRRRIPAAGLRAAMDLVGAAIAGRSAYLIQHGVETMRHAGSTFDIRVTMLHDGCGWHWLHEARLSPAGSDVSNVSQGGSITVTEDLLFRVMGAEAARNVLYRLRGESFALAAYLERLHPGDILEVAFDFVIDEHGGLRLLEVNTKPGLAGIGSDISVFAKRPEHEPLFEAWVYPHAKHLAGFLLRKACSPAR